MKIHLISDLHCDFSPYRNEFPDEADVVVIAGDVAEDIKHLRDICNYNSMHDIIFVPGNHDFYGGSIEVRLMMFAELENECKNLKVLYNQSITIGDVDFFGTTLWSNMNAYPEHQYHMKQWYPVGLSDSRYIYDWDADMMIAEFNLAKRSIEEFLDAPSLNKKVVITHFSPSLNSVHERFKNDVPFNSYWCNSLQTKLITKADIWMHGHVHNVFDYEVFSYETLESCRVVCNPRGYVSKYGIENLEFDPTLILEI
jgi:Icc-related predicted phosphoesterase